MTYVVRVLPRAKQDGQEIDDYLSAHNVAAADRFGEQLQATIDLQAAIPTPGSRWMTDNPLLAELRWTRVKGFRQYIVFMKVRGTLLEIVRILHASRDLESVLSQ